MSSGQVSKLGSRSAASLDSSSDENGRISSSTSTISQSGKPSVSGSCKSSGFRYNGNVMVQEKTRALFICSAYERLVVADPRIFDQPNANGEGIEVHELGPGTFVLF
jgi:hypothetical protein